MVIDALGSSTLGESGPATSGTSAATKRRAPEGIQGEAAAVLVTPTFGSRGGRSMILGSAGSSMITTTGKIATKKFRNSTMSGVMATPLLMSNAVAVTKSSTRQSNWVIW